MARRFITIEIETREIHLAVSAVGEKGPHLLEARSVTFSADDGPVEALHKLWQELQPGIVDSVELLLPAMTAYARTLDYPFKSSRKLAGVVPPDFWHRLPVDSHGLVLDYVVYPGGAQQSRVAVAAVATERLRQELELFAEAKFPLARVTVLPWGLGRSGAGEGERELLAWQREGELGLALCEGGEVSRYALLPLADEWGEDQCTWLVRQADILEREGGWNGLPVRLYGIDDLLRERLTESGRSILEPGLEGVELAAKAPQTKVGQLALEGVRSRRLRRHNFLKGEFAPESGWQGLRRPLRYSLGLLVGVMVLFGISLWSGYLRQVREADQLEARAENLLRTTFPEIRTIVDASRQMQGQLQQLRAQAGTGRDTTNAPLTLLRAMSQQLPEGLDVTLNEWAMSSGEVRIAGSTVSFEDVDRLAESFGRLAGVQQAAVAESKLGSDSRVVFRMRLVLGEQP